MKNFKFHFFSRNIASPKLKNFIFLFIANLYSFFIIECLSNHVKVILEKEYRFNTKAFKDKFIKINFKNLKGFDKLKRI